MKTAPPEIQAMTHIIFDLKADIENLKTALRCPDRFTLEQRAHFRKKIDILQRLTIALALTRVNIMQRRFLAAGENR